MTIAARLPPNNIRKYKSLYAAYCTQIPIMPFFFKVLIMHVPTSDFPFRDFSRYCSSYSYTSINSLYICTAYRGVCKINITIHIYIILEEGCYDPEKIYVVSLREKKIYLFLV